MGPKVSVIIPTYNRPKVIGRAIQSVLNQTYQNFEIIVIDDSPNDETEKVVKGFSDKRIKYIHNKERTNLPRARNQGVRESSEDSKYIAFLDDDDEWLSRFLERTVEELEKNKEAVMATTYVELKTKKGERISVIRCKGLKFWQQTIGSGCVIKKEIFTKKNFWYDERKVCEDLDFGIRVLKDHKWICIPEILKIYYYSSDEISLSTALPIKEIELFYKKHHRLYSQLGRKALGSFHCHVGKLFCQAGEIKKGRNHLLKAFLNYPIPRHLFYYLISLFTPKFFQDIRLRVLKHKIFKGKL
jgi:glycosyltransferase involved in cell wall biosynthesis